MKRVAGRIGLVGGESFPSLDWFVAFYLFSALRCPYKFYSNSAYAFVASLPAWLCIIYSTCPFSRSVTPCTRLQAQQTKFVAEPACSPFKCISLSRMTRSVGIIRLFMSMEACCVTARGYDNEPASERAHRTSHVKMSMYREGNEIYDS